MHRNLCRLNGRIVWPSLVVGISALPAHRHDPLGPLADAIGSMTGTLSDQVANALHQVLEAAMLIDQNKLKGATVFAGGHRRVSHAAVMEWRTKHLQA